MAELFLDDFKAGDTFQSDGVTLTECEIIDFAQKYDPQYFHLDVNAAAESIYGGLIASGFQTLAVCFRLFIQKGILAKSSLGSPGIDNLKWRAPVRPGDTLKTKTEVLEIKPSTSKPDRGILRLQYSAINQHGDEVLSFVLNHLLKRNGKR